MPLPSPKSAHIVRPDELSASEIELWASYSRQDAALAHPFYSFAFARAVGRVHPHAFIAILESQGRAIGFLPFQFSGRLARALKAAERIGGDLSDRFGVIAGNDVRLEPNELLHLAGLHSISYSFLPAEQ